MNKYKYSFDLGAFFGSEEKETKLKAAPEVETSILPRPKQKQEAVQEAKPEYDPYGFIPDFAAAYEGAGGVPSVGSDLPLPAGEEQSRYALAVESLLNEMQGSLTPQPSLTAATPALNLEPPVVKDSKEESKPDEAEAIQAAVEGVLSEVADTEEGTPVTTEEETTGGLMGRGPSKRAKLVTEPRKTDEFYLNIGKKAETDHGSTPQVTNDAREANLPEAEKTRDIGFGHKITPTENTKGKIHGIKFKNEDGTFISLSDKDKRTILKADMQLHQDAARKSGWDTKLKNIGTSWDKLDAPYQNALTSLAYNVGGGKAGKTWTNVLTAAKNKDVSAFALGLRRKDAGKNTAGMDNRVAKELYYAGLISNLSEVSDQLPLANATQAGIPE